LSTANPVSINPELDLDLCSGKLVA
jgi:hypothetical protein